MLAKKGLNQLVIYDEDGKQPSQTLIVAEEEAGRTITQIIQILNNQ
jgi:beta-galactosidase